MKAMQDFSLDDLRQQATEFFLSPKGQWAAILIVGLVSVAIAAYVVLSRDQTGQAAKELQQATQQAQLALMNAETFQGEPLPPLPLIWSQVRLLSEGCGLKWDTVPLEAEVVPGDYTGSVPSWRAVLTGPPLLVLHCASVILDFTPIHLGRLEASRDPSSSSSTLRIAVFGVL